jgi:autotransporter-associated beta strand protein
LTIVNPGSGYTVAPTVSIAGPGVPNSYSGPTTVDSGTLALSGSSASSITIGSSGVLEMALVTSNSPTTTGSLRFNSGAKVQPVGIPTDASYTLVTSAQPITGTPALEAPIPGYVLVIEGNSLKLNAGTANTAPVITAAQGFSVAENAALATVVGTVVATDPDANSILSEWTIVSGNTGSAFAINPTTGQITLAGVLNYEGTSSYSLGVTVSDGTATSAVGTVVVTVTNVVEYSDFFGSSSPTADDNGDGISNLMAYALGATSPSSVVLPPALNTADPTKLTITALIRINDPKLSVVGIYGLAPGTWVTGSPISGVESSSQAGVVAGVTQRQDFSVLRGTDSKKFMYLKATQTP